MVKNEHNRGRNEKGEPFNPLSTGILFFALWLTLRATKELGSVQEKFSSVMLAFSLLSLLPFVWPWLREKLGNGPWPQIIMPSIVELAVAGYVLGWLSVLNDLPESVRVWSFIVGFAWLVAYLMVAQAKFQSKFPKAGVKVVAGLAAIWIVVAAGAAVTSGILSAWPVVLIIAAHIVAAARPNWFRSIPLV